MTISSNCVADLPVSSRPVANSRALRLWQDRNGVAQVEARRLVADELARLQSELTAMRE